MEINKAIIPYAIPPLLAAIYAAILGIFVFMNNLRSKVNGRFSLFMLVCTTWLAGFSAMNMMKNAPDAFIFVRILYTGVMLIPTFYYHFVVEFLGLKNRRSYLFCFYLLSSIFIALLWTTKSIVRGTTLYSWGYSGDSAEGHLVFLLFFFYGASFAIWDLWRAICKTHDTIVKNKIKYVLIAFVIALFASTDYLSTYRIDYYPLGFVFMIIFSLITSYAIIKHKLMDINVVIKKGVLYSLLFTSISFIFVVFILIANMLSRVYFGYSSWFFVYVATLLIAVLFIPIHNRSIRFLNKMFYGAQPTELSEQNYKLMSEVQKQDRLKSIATLAAGMAHEIKNPLTSIKTFAEYLPTKYDDPEFRRKFSRIVSDEVDRVNGILGQLLEFSKPSPPQLRPIPISDLLNETLELLSNNLLKHKIELYKHFDSSIVISGDKNQLKQAFLNIFLNSIQSMNNGGRLSVTAYCVVNERVKTSISDTGKGMSATQIQHAFDPFYTTKEDGTGLGLAIVHGIITKHGGKVEIRSALGISTTVDVFLKI